MGIKLRQCSPRVGVLFHQAWLLHGRMEQTYKATAQIHEIWELLIKLKARIVNILCVSHSLASQIPTRASFQYTSWQKIAHVPLAGSEAGKRRMSGRRGKKVRKGLEEKTCTREMALVGTLPAAESQRERAKPRRNVRGNLQLSRPGRTRGRWQEHDINWQCHPRSADVSEAVGRTVQGGSPGRAQRPRLSSATWQRKQERKAVQLHLGGMRCRFTSN